jgi:pimeloyl-ACP methyl ester carboxylesterase
MEIRTRIVEANGIRFNCLEAGSGPLMLCLHGFPDDARSFLGIIDYFANRGYRVVAPFLRGYAPTEGGDGCFQSALLALDVLALIDALGGNPAFVLGHDWGAHMAYGAALIDPSKIRALIGLAVPFGSFREALMVDQAQRKRSWYMFFFRMPFAVQALLNEDCAMIEGLWRDWSCHLPEAQMRRAIETFQQPGVAQAAIEYYRQMTDATQHRPELEWIQQRLLKDRLPVPVLYLHGQEDGCIGVRWSEGMEAFCDAGLERHVIPEAGHFLHLEAPETVQNLVEHFLERQGCIPAVSKHEWNQFATARA